MGILCYKRQNFSSEMQPCSIGKMARSNFILRLEHTGRFDSNFSHIFKSNTKFELLYERRPKVNIHVKYSAKQCRIMDQSQILQPGPHFIIRPTYMANFRSKIFFQQYKHQGWTKRTLKSISLISNCIFCEKNYIFKIFFCDF